MSGNSYKEPDHIEPEVKQETPKKKKKAHPIVKGVQSVLDGTILARESVLKSIPFVFYLALLIVLYIANTYYAEKKIIEIEKIKKELKELRSENITSKSNWMFSSRQSAVIKRIEQYGIKESLIPPRKIFVESVSAEKETASNE